MMQKGLAGGGLLLGDFLGDYIVLDEKYSGMYLDKKGCHSKI